MIDGIINVYKPSDMTSHDVVAIMRTLLGIKKIGHTGTLDPMAVGVLPICIGKATRVMEYLDMDLKTYICTLRLGVITDTQDIWGQIIEKRDCSNVTKEDILKATENFRGIIEQRPPMYSALKVNGKKLYEYAREGKSVDVKLRKIYIDNLTIDSFDGDAGEVTFSVTCSKGTYVRTICQDIGEALGCGATMTKLERAASGVFTKAESVNLEDLREMAREEVLKFVQNPDIALENFGVAILDEFDTKIFTNGGRIPASRWKKEKAPKYESEDFYLPIRDEYKNAYNVYGEINGQKCFLGVGFVADKGLLKADKIFYAR